MFASPSTSFYLIFELYQLARLDDCLTNIQILCLILSCRNSFVEIGHQINFVCFMRWNFIFKIVHKLLKDFI